MGEAEVHADAADGCDIAFGRPAFAPEHAFELCYGTDDKADILAALALQNTGGNRRRALALALANGATSAAMAIPSVEGRMGPVSA